MLAHLVLTTAATAKSLPISAIQGAAHESPYEGKIVTTEGVVTRVYGNGFIIESRSPDSSLETSEAIYVYEKGTQVSIGNEVRVTGMVEEYIPGGEDSYNLSLTQIRLEELQRLSTQTHLPKPVVLNYLMAGFPKTIKKPGHGFDPSVNAMDFWESLEHMRVTIMDASVIGPRSKFGEIVLRVSQGDIGTATPKGGSKLTDYNSNAARVLVILTQDNPHSYSTGDIIPEIIQGNVTYSYGNYKVGASKPISVAKTPERINPTFDLQIPDDSLKFASFNVENLYNELPDEKFKQLATTIVKSLHAPQIVGLQEIHDNSGPKNDGTVDASEVLNKLTEFITEAGGPEYKFLQLNPENNADGGWPGANIRNAYLYTDEVILGKSYSFQDPAFEADDNTGFSGTRKTLVAFFTHRDKKMIFLNCHLKSKGGDTSTYGSLRPAIRFSETQRMAQTRSLRRHVDQLQTNHPDAHIVVLGDMNDYEFSPSIKILTQNEGLVNLINTLPLNERYTYIFQGYSQVLDHILVSPNLAPKLRAHIANVNSDFSEALRTSDHDPVLAWFK